MTVPGNIDALLLGGQRGYQIERSLRFNSADSAYLNRTPASASNRKTWTWSAWVKKSDATTSGTLFAARTGVGATYLTVVMSSAGDFRMESNSETAYPLYKTNALFRDPAAWYHFIVVLDMTQATSANRLKVYVNGIEQTAASYNVPAQNTDLAVNSTETHLIGQQASGNYFGGYLTEVHFIDGQALTPSSFGETDTITGVWKPKKYAGTYGTNGFYLKFADNSGTTSTTLGKDSSPNGNNFTPNNFSVTAGAGNDSLIDTPTPYADGGNGRGNYCTLNPLRTALTPTNGNLTITGNNSWRGTAATMQIPASGLYYFEVSTSTANQRIIGGLVTASLSMSANSWQVLTGFIGVAADSGNWNVMNNVSAGNTLLYSLGGTGASEVIGIAINATTGNMWFSRNNVWYNSTGSATGDPAAGTNPTWTGLTASNYFPAAQCYDNAVDVHINFGQRAFAYTPPSGFKALNTQNLPEPTIKKPSSYMDTLLYTGNGSARSITGLGFSPDLVWIKERSGADNHRLVDAVRGATKELYSSLTNAEGTDANGLTAFNSDGFSLGTSNSYNENGVTHVAWCWDESATPGFDIVTYTGTGSNTDINHNLGVIPSFAIIKQRNTAQSWWVWHTALGNNVNANNTMLELNGTAGTYAADDVFRGFTSSVFKVGTDSGSNTNGGTYVAYLWSEVANFSKFGFYTGNGSSDGPFVFCGFRPRWVMMKSSTNAATPWQIFDSARETFNTIEQTLVANGSNAEPYDTASPVDFLSNGFKLRGGASSYNNYNTGTWIFAAFAETPMKYSLAF